MTAPAAEITSAVLPVGAASSSGESLTIAAAARSAQVAVSAAAMRDAIVAWQLLDPKRVDATFPAWLQAMMLLTKAYHAQSSAAAATSYRSIREVATLSPAPASLIRTAPVPNEEWLTRAFGFSGPGMLNRDTAQPNTALSTTLGTTARIVQDGGRTTTINTAKADPVAVGYYRVTDPDPCSFCALLASRGVVYKADTVGFLSHNHCHCTGAPAFSHNQELPAANTAALEVYKDSTKGLPNKDRLAVFRKAWDARGI